MGVYSDSQLRACAGIKQFKHKTVNYSGKSGTECPVCKLHERIEKLEAVRKAATNYFDGGLVATGISAVRKALKEAE